LGNDCSQNLVGFGSDFDSAAVFASALRNQMARSQFPSLFKLALKTCPSLTGQYQRSDFISPAVNTMLSE
jgi:hypothetical protein